MRFAEISHKTKYIQTTNTEKYVLFHKESQKDKLKAK